jgi:hypothetical protein
MVQFDDELTDDFGRTLKGWIGHLSLLMADRAREDRL